MFVSFVVCCTACRIASRGGYTIATRWGGTTVILLYARGIFSSTRRVFLVFLFYLLFVKFIPNPFGSQPCRTPSHQRKIPTTYCLCWVVWGFGLVGLGWVEVRQHGLGWSWVGSELHYTQTWKHAASVGLCWVWLELGWVGLEPCSLVTTEHHPSVVLTAADVFHFFK